VTLTLTDESGSSAHRRLRFGLVHAGANDFQFKARPFGKLRAGSGHRGTQAAQTACSMLRLRPCGAGSFSGEQPALRHRPQDGRDRVAGAAGKRRRCRICAGQYAHIHDLGGRSDRFLSGAGEPAEIAVDGVGRGLAFGPTADRASSSGPGRWTRRRQPQNGTSWAEAWPCVSEAAIRTVRRGRQRGAR